MTVQTWLAGAIVAATLATASIAATPSDELIAREASWSRAMVAKDVAGLKDIIAPEWIGQNQSGKPLTRAEFLAGITSGEDKVSSMTNHDVHVRIIGDIALVQGMDTEVSTHKGVSSSGTYSWLDVFQKRAGKWVAIASQNTPVTAKH
jgi:ketosteroid isomerase-like protein